MILAWYAFTILAGVCIMFTVAHVVGGWLERSEPEPLRLPESAREPDRVAEMEAVAAAAWGRWDD